MPLKLSIKALGHGTSRRSWVTRGWKIVGVLLLCLALTSSMACNPFGGDGSQEESRQLVNVERGDLMVSVTGSGNIDIANEIRLAFGTSGRIDKIYVKEGDKVSKGDELAKLDTAALELALTQTQVVVTQAQVAQTQAQVALETAKYNLDVAQETYKWPELKVAQAEVDDAEAYLEYALEKLSQAAPAQQASWQLVVVRAQASLSVAEAKLDAMLAGYDTEEVAIKKLQVEAAEQSLELAQQSLEQAQQSLAYAQKQLDEATITAPFAGVVATVSAKPGDTIVAGTPITYLIDLTSTELKIDVDEIDIPTVKVNQSAIISVDALPALQLEGKVTFISPVPKVEAGVVLYSITIDPDVPEDSGVKVGMSATG